MQCSRECVTDKIASYPKIWTSITLALVLTIFIVSCTQANVTEAEKSGDTDSFGEVKCGQWGQTSGNQLQLSAPGEYFNPYGIEYKSDGSEAEWECGWPTANSAFRLCTLSFILIANAIHLAALFGYSCSVYTNPGLQLMYALGSVLMFASFSVDCNQIRIGGGVCSAMIKTMNNGDSLECDNGRYIGTACGGFFVSLFAYVCFKIVGKGDDASAGLPGGGDGAEPLNQDTAAP